MYNVPGFEPARKQFEPPQKGGRQCAGLRQQILPGGAAILLGVPENQNHRMVVFILCITSQDLNLRESSSNRRKKADGSAPVCVSKFCQVAQQSCWACQKIKTAVWRFLLLKGRVFMKSFLGWGMIFFDILVI